MPIGIYKHKSHSKETRKKMSLAKTGEKHWNWKGGKTSEAMKVRNSDEYKEWRKKVFERDNFTCQKCSHRGGGLEAHHIKRFADDKEKQLLLKNGITYCRDCHSKFNGHQRCLTKIEREKISKKLLGRKFSIETKRKMSIAKRGSVPWNKGLKTKKNKICLLCKEEFYPKKRKQIYCGLKCSNIINGNKSKYLIKNKLI